MSHFDPPEAENRWLLDMAGNLRAFLKVFEKSEFWRNGQPAIRYGAASYMK